MEFLVKTIKICIMKSINNIEIYSTLFLKKEGGVKDEKIYTGILYFMFELGSC
jgi:hypothetical protein